MTKDDVEHLAQVCESLRAQCIAQGGFSVSMDFDNFVGRILWAIRSSQGTPEFDEGRFGTVCRGEGGLRVFDEVP